MPIEAWVTIGIALSGSLATWGVWITAFVFRIDRDNSNIKNDIEILLSIKDVIGDIREEMKEQRKKPCPRL